MRKCRGLLPPLLMLAGAIVLICSLPSWAWTAVLGLILIVSGAALLKRRC